MSSKVRRSFVDKVSEEDFIKIVQESVSLSEIKRKLGYKTTSNCIPEVIKRRIKDLNLDVSHFMPTSLGKKVPTGKRYTMEEILVKESDYVNFSTLKKRLIDGNYFKNQCGQCGLDTWKDKNISLQLHHKNGVNNDNRLENLELLCPNCHSQTDFFGGKLQCVRHRRRLKLKDKKKK